MDSLRKARRKKVEERIKRNFKVIPLKKLPGYFISEGGYVFKVADGKDIECSQTIQGNKREVYVEIDGKKYNVLHLMIEYFIGDLSIKSSLKYKINKKCQIPLSTIKAIKSDGSVLSEEDSRLIGIYKCSEKASGANARARDIVTPMDILNVLKKHEFRCGYCGCDLFANTWQIDHFLSLSVNGKNIPSNIVPSCQGCNVMKHTQDGNSFYKRCLQIVTNYSGKGEYVKNLIEAKSKKLNQVLDAQNDLMFINQLEQT
jgi:hypothetical protein